MPRAPEATGRVLDGRYELHAVVGEGTFGRVYRGRDRRLERSVAVKVIKPWWAEDPAWARKFQREAQLLARVSDPGIVQIFDVGQASEGLYYVAELVDGESLSGRLEGGALAPEEARDLAEQLCRALARAHAAGIVHRDIKPANVLISSSGRVKLGDFGVARLAEGSTGGTAGEVIGTPRYMAPEQARGLGTTPATDVYSVGVVLYEMLTGDPPFAGDSAIELALNHVQDAPPPLPRGIPRDLRQIVERALAKDPRHRYRDAGEMASALARPGDAVSRSGVSSRRPMARRSTPEPTRVAPKLSPRRNVNPSARRRSVGLVLLAFGLVAAMILAAVLLAPPGRMRRFAGPPPVKVPGLVGQASSSAGSILSSLGLREAVTPAPAPGVQAGVVTAQAPRAGRYLLPRATVALTVAEPHRWRRVASFSGTDAGASVPFRIRGDHWRVTYTMSFAGTCSLIFFCGGPTAAIVRPGGGPPVDSFGMNDGGAQTEVLSSGPGVYQVRISAGSDSAQWSMQVEDYY